MNINLGGIRKSNSKEEEIDLNELLNIFLLNKKLIAIASLLSLLIGIIFASTRTKIWEGEFQIVLNQKNSQGLLFSNSVDFPFLTNENEESLKTEIGILESPLVLSSVFDFVKENQKKVLGKGEESNLNFKSWKKSFLNIDLKPGTQILNLSYKDKNKEMILPVLNMISGEYQEYSKRDHEREISKTIKYLQTQKKIYEKQYFNSSATFNDFSIENGLGNIDGFVSLESKVPKTFAENFDLTETLLKNNLKAGQRFKKQFQTLENYETLYIDMSSKLKPNSKALIQLKNKIENLRQALKRPSEILIKYRELKQNMNRDEYILLDFNNKLVQINLEKAKIKDPWELITTPNLNPNPVSPRKKLILFSFVSLGFLLSFLYSIFKDKKEGIIYKLDDISSSFDIPVIANFYYKDKKLIASNLEFIFNCNKEKENIAILVLESLENKRLSYFKDVLSQKFSNYNFSLTNEIGDIKDFSKFLIISLVGYSKIDDLSIIVQRLHIEEKSNVSIILLNLIK